MVWPDASPEAWDHFLPSRMPGSRAPHGASPSSSSRGLGVSTEHTCLDLVRDLDAADRRRLTAFGVRFGTRAVFVKPMMSSPDLALRSTLWALAHDHGHGALRSVEGRGRSGSRSVPSRFLLARDWIHATRRPRPSRRHGRETGRPDAQADTPRMDPGSGRSRLLVGIEPRSIRRHCRGPGISCAHRRRRRAPRPGPTAADPAGSARPLLPLRPVSQTWKSPDERRRHAHRQVAVACPVLQDQVHGDTTRGKRPPAAQPAAGHQVPRHTPTQATSSPSRRIAVCASSG